MYAHKTMEGRYRSIWGLIIAALLVQVGSAYIGPRTIVSPAFFNSLLAAIPTSCAGKAFYNYDAFIDAAESFVGFGTTGTTDDGKREIAAFLANVMHETGSLCYIQEISPSSTYCSPSTLWPCAPGKSYFGRGPIQLTWNYNYGPAGKDIGLDLLSNPEIVAQNPRVAFKTSLWFWMRNSNCHRGITTGGGFASTIKAINGGECGGRRPKSVNNRVNFYIKFCKQFGVNPGEHLYC